MGRSQKPLYRGEFPNTKGGGGVDILQVLEGVVFSSGLDTPNVHYSFS